MIDQWYNILSKQIDILIHNSECHTVGDSEIIEMMSKKYHMSEETATQLVKEYSDTFIPCPEHIIDEYNEWEYD